jgi:hypothetical protein
MNAVAIEAGGCAPPVYAHSPSIRNEWLELDRLRRQVDAAPNERERHIRQSVFHNALCRFSDRHWHALAAWANG